VTNCGRGRSVYLLRGSSRSAGLSGLANKTARRGQLEIRKTDEVGGGRERRHDVGRSFWGKSKRDAFGGTERGGGRYGGEQLKTEILMRIEVWSIPGERFFASKPSLKEFSADFAPKRVGHGEGTRPEEQGD
jgi:hypothetical protein